ncbi:MAG: hypothetical protein AAF674_12755 [Pseudomonadota bacterium]
MASFGGFVRKSPANRLRQFFEARGVAIPDGFDWSSEGRGNAFVKSIEKLVGDLPDRQQDAVKAELDLLASLADANGMTSAEQVCAGQGIDLEGLEGVQDVLLTMAIEHTKALERTATQASLTRRTGGRNWAAFQFDEGTVWALEESAARASFLEEAISILELPTHRKREADWYKSVRVHPTTGEESEVVQATIYVEERAESELAFGASETLERQLVQKVLEVGVSCDPKDHVVEICTRGGKAVRDKYAKAFAKHFAPSAEMPIETPRREVLLDKLREAGVFETEPADGIENVELSELHFYSSGGGFARFERRGDDETIHQFLNRRFGEASPLKASGWQIVSATLRIVLSPTDGARRKTLTVTLRTPNTTTLPNKTEADWQFVLRLLERWRLIAPQTPDEPLVDAA